MNFSTTHLTVSSFFAQVIGIYLILICLAMLLQHHRFKKIMTEIIGHPASMFICSATNIIFAVVILVPHDLWVANWHVLITIIGWLTLIKGVAGLYFPDKYAEICKKFMATRGYQIWTWIWLLIGLYLVVMGFTSIIK